MHEHLEAEHQEAQEALVGQPSPNAVRLGILRGVSLVPHTYDLWVVDLGYLPLVKDVPTRYPPPPLEVCSLAFVSAKHKDFLVGRGKLSLGRSGTRSTRRWTQRVLDLLHQTILFTCFPCFPDSPPLNR